MLRRDTFKDKDLLDLFNILPSDMNIIERNKKSQKGNLGDMIFIIDQIDSRKLYFGRENHRYISTAQIILLGHRRLMKQSKSL